MRSRDDPGVSVARPVPLRPKPDRPSVRSRRDAAADEAGLDLSEMEERMAIIFGLRPAQIEVLSQVDYKGRCRFYPDSKKTTKVLIKKGLVVERNQHTEARRNQIDIRLVKMARKLRAVLNADRITAKRCDRVSWLADDMADLACDRDSKALWITKKGEALIRQVEKIDVVDTDRYGSGRSSAVRRFYDEGGNNR